MHPVTISALRAFRGRLAPALIVLAVAALAAPAGGLAKSAPSILEFKVMEVAAPGNPAVGIVPFSNAIYRTCAEAPKPKTRRSPKCQMVGGVGYPFGIGRLEVTVGQWVKFLNTADPEGRNKRRLYSETESGAAWPRFGQIDYSAGAGRGRHYSPGSAGMGRQALRVRQLLALGPLRQLALQRQAAVEDQRQRRSLPVHHLPGAALP